MTGKKKPENFHELLLGVARGLARKEGKEALDLESLWMSYLHLAKKGSEAARAALDEELGEVDWRQLVPADVPAPDTDLLPIDRGISRLVGPLSPLAKKHAGEFTEQNFVPLLRQTRLLDQVLNLEGDSGTAPPSCSERRFGLKKQSKAEKKSKAGPGTASTSPPDGRPKKAAGRDIESALDAVNTRLEAAVFGQTAAIRAFSDALGTALRRPVKSRRVRGSFLLFGPNGCGKSEMVSILEAWVQEHKRALPVKRLLYCEAYLHNALPTLRKQIREKSDPGILVFNEFEKYEPELRDILLEGFSRGELVLPDRGMGGKLESTPIGGWVVLLVGNVGRKFWGRLPFKEKDILPDSEQIREALEEESIEDQHRKAEFLQGRLSRSFLDRIETFIPFCQLRYADVGRILSREIHALQQELEARNVKLTVQDRVCELVVLRSHFKRGWSARQILRGFAACIEGVARSLVDGAGCEEVHMTCTDKVFNRIMNKSKPRILVVDDECESVAKMVAGALGEQAEVAGVEDVDGALNAAASSPFDLVLLDMHFHGKVMWREYLGRWRAAQPDTSVCLFSSKQMSSSDRIEMDRLGGVIGFFPKSPDEASLRAAILPMLDHAAWQARIRSFQEQYGYGGDQVTFDVLPVGRSGKGKVSFCNVGSVVADRGVDDADDPVLPPQTAQEIDEFLDIFLDAQKRAKLGAKRPKGLLLWGPPGNGKTMVARSLARSMRCNFMAVAAADFKSRWAGMASEKLRDLFEKAKQRQPCVIFIDEIDGVAAQRSDDTGGGLLREEANVVATLLTLMDGFEGENDIFVIGATNRKDAIDEAILRPGRLDRHIEVLKPGVAERRKILERCLAQRKVHDLDPEWAARETFGMSAAELVAAVSNSVLVALRRVNADDAEAEIIVGREDFLEACDRIRYGESPRSGSLDEKILAEERECTAWHEAGHLVLRIILLGEIPERATIIPRGDYGGFVRTSEEDVKRRSYSFRRTTGVKEIAVCLGGGLAEEIKFKEHSSGVSGDRRTAWNLAYAMVSEWGMGPLEAEGEARHAAAGRLPAPVSVTSSCPQATAAAAGIIREAEELARSQLEKHAADLEHAAGFLLEHEDLDQAAIRKAFGALTNAG